MELRFAEVVPTTPGLLSGEQVLEKKLVALASTNNGPGWRFIILNIFMHALLTPPMDIW